jgi:prepilin-type processing-associated H-X9-DG protein
MNRRGFTVRDLLAVIVSLTILISLIVLALPSGTCGGTGEASRRMQCQNNLKQFALALQNYHDTHLFLPAGASSQAESEANGSGQWGPSWIACILPYCEQRPPDEAIASSAQEHPHADYLSDELRSAAAQHSSRGFHALSCPSSSLPDTEVVDGIALRLASYAGIMGANNDRLHPIVTRGGPVGDVVRGPYGGWAAANGMLPINENLTFADCTDGSSNTIIVGEVSDWYYDDAGKKFITSLSVSDAGDGWRAAAGWIAGTDLKAPIRLTGSAVLADRICNLITISHPVGTNNRRGTSDNQPNWGTKGIGRCGLNNPLSSAHPRGAMVAFLDGHVQMLTKETDLRVLQLLAIRGDDQRIPELD